MFEIALAVTATTTIILSVVVYRLKNFYDAAIGYAAHLVSKNNTMTKIISAHGCAPRKLVAEGSIYNCPDCEIVWVASAAEVDWLDDNLSNLTVQRWDVFVPPTVLPNLADTSKDSALPDT